MRDSLDRRNGGRGAAVTDVDDWSDPADDGREPDISDYEEARANEEYWEHCDEVHGGKDCDCPRPALDDGTEYSDEAPF